MSHGDIIKKALKNHHGYSASKVKSPFLKKIDNFEKFKILASEKLKLVENQIWSMQKVKDNVNCRPQNLAKIVRYDNLDGAVYIWGIECCIALLALTVDSRLQKNWILKI